MKTVIVQLKCRIAQSVQACVEIRKAIRDLTWVEGSLEKVREIRSQRSPEGKPVNGHRALKEFRRPETGEQRSNLWARKRDAKYAARHALLALAMAQGRPYKSVERSCREENAPSCLSIECHLNEYLPKGSEVSRDSVYDWLNGIPAKVVEVAA